MHARTARRHADTDCPGPSFGIHHLLVGPIPVSPVGPVSSGSPVYVVCVYAYAVQVLSSERAESEVTPVRRTKEGVVWIV